VSAHGAEWVVVEDLQLSTFGSRVVGGVGEIEAHTRWRLRDELCEVPVLDDDDTPRHELVRLVGSVSRNGNDTHHADEHGNDAHPAHATDLRGSGGPVP
jgi:hypothetical protein